MRRPWKKIDGLKPLGRPFRCPSTQIPSQCRRITREIKNPLKREIPLKEPSRIRTQPASGRIDQTKRGSITHLEKSILKVILKATLEQLRLRSFPLKC
jgi:hypothetical protein